MIPLCDARQQYLQLQEEIDAVMQEVATSGNYILGPQVEAFEQEMADYCGCQFAVGIGSGTDALHLSLRALDIGPGDEVITTPFTFIATTEAIGLVGATPVFVDIDSRTYNIDPELIEQAITPRTKAILPVHLFGQPCDMDAIVDIASRYDLRIVEDCAQALGAEYRGAKVGTIGNVGCLSFFPSKNLGCFGDGGMIVTDDVRVYERTEMLRRHGGKVKYHHTELGLNSRLDELHAAVLRVKLPHLNHWNHLRRQLAYEYNRLLESCPEVTTPFECGSQSEKWIEGTQESADVLYEEVYHQYTIQVDNRAEMMSHLHAKSIGCAIYYPVPLHLQQVHQSLRYRRGDFPIAEHASAHCLSLPMFPNLHFGQQQKVVTAIRESTEVNLAA